LWFCKKIRDEQPVLADIMFFLESKAKTMLPSLTFHTSREEYEKKLAERDDFEDYGKVGRVCEGPPHN
jgi:hypothetical protein